MRKAALLLLPLALAGCGSKDTDPGPGGVTVGEAKALDEAAQMIDSRKLPPEALQDGTGPSEGAPSTAASE